MINFNELDDNEIILFIENNKDSFAKHIDSNFVVHATKALDDEVLKILKKPEGFVTGYIGSPIARQVGTTRHVTIDFIYVAPQHRKKGIAIKLLSEFLNDISNNRSIELSCEGTKRMEKFTAMGFKVVEESNNFFKLKLETKDDLNTNR
jgi:ribosomal protein S18 acetylase RimI-like enzyme